MGNSASYLREMFQEKDGSGTFSSSDTDTTPDSKSTVEYKGTPIEEDLCARGSRRRARTLDYNDPLARGSYVQIEDPEDYDNVMIKFHKMRILDNDPRSPTIGIIRTPIEVITSSERTSSSSYLKTSKSVDDLTLSSELPSVKLCDPRSPSIEVVRTPIQVPIWNDVPEEEKCTPKPSKSMSTKKQKENIENLAKKLFESPDHRATSSQIRTPLRTMTTNGNSAYHILRAKQSHGINMEMNRTSGIENTPPPCLNKYDLASTKPKQHNSPQWGHDSTLII
ncbi:hypothetical protein L9F63_007501 [Diploptera punctata]|uniref:Uncharacterized protein n=1 Tax=Diploptera punctata TaxID=6984 RepID=A0AAD7Z8C8_DIPPU|nr:hypothetical protein L9F63_007501 [Diploptera punctata]